MARAVQAGTIRAPGIFDLGRTSTSFTHPCSLHLLLLLEGMRRQLIAFPISWHLIIDKNMASPNPLPTRSHSKPSLSLSDPGIDVPG